MTTKIFDRFLALVVAVVALVREGSRKLEEVLEEVCDALQRVKDNPEFRTRLTPSTVSDFSRFWPEVYRKLGLGEMEHVSLEHRPGFWPIVVMKGMTPQKVLNALKNHFPCWQYIENLDTAVTQNDREASETYVIYVQATEEADPELKNRSANQLKKDGAKCITLLERLLLEAFYFFMRGKHLDIEAITLCAGSRRSGGRVPVVHWDDDKLCVGWYGAGGRYDFVRSRTVVS